MKFCLVELGDDLWLFRDRLVPGDTAWPASVGQMTSHHGLPAGAKRKMLGENALRLCSGLRGSGGPQTMGARWPAASNPAAAEERDR